jgi:hypothetical protein
MYAHHAVLPINNLHLQIDLPIEFSNCKTVEIIVLPINPSSPTMTKASLKINGLNELFAKMPKLAEEADFYADDLKTIRQQLPLETSQWD